MKCAIHQPQFLPWLGYLHKIKMADVFVFLDQVQFKKNEFQNRNKVMISEQAGWLTVPVSFRFGDSVRDTRIAETTPWRRKVGRTLEYNYGKAPFFRPYADELARLLERPWMNLAELNQATVRWLLTCFDIRTDIRIASEWSGLDEHPTRRLIDICRRVGADTYVSGAGGRSYLDTELFQTEGMKLEFQAFIHPVYPQHSRKADASFVSNLSAVDGLFNCGGGVEGRRVLNLDS